jgi:Protein of unknown function (DUF3253)
VDEVDCALEERILDLLAQRDVGTTICPSEAARVVYRETTSDEVTADRTTGADEGWRDLMEPARQAARRLVAAGRLEITQGGNIVDPDHATGPIRLRLAGGKR